MAEFDEVTFYPAQNSKYKADYEVVDNQATIVYTTDDGKLDRYRQTGTLFTRFRLYGLGYNLDADEKPISPFQYISYGHRWYEYKTLDDVLDGCAFNQILAILDKYDVHHIECYYIVYDASTKERIFDWSFAEGNDTEYQYAKELEREQFTPSAALKW